ncbi:hypothetical protein IPN35_05925 [Candidatus Peregrinibacteria bacterium]|nr:MAG: hypothetical protein IPN35_05925 [Candidatus Peregrinibacteria bacterium]
MTQATTTQNGWMQQQELLSEVQRCVDLFNSQVFLNNSVFRQSAFIELLVRLNYVLQVLDKNSKRITWTDDLEVTKKIKDITDLVNNLRNAACHQESRRNFVEGTNLKFVFNTITGEVPRAIQIGNKFLGCDYADDIAFYYGDKKIYLVRHIKKLLEELPNLIKTK